MKTHISTLYRLIFLLILTLGFLNSSCKKEKEKEFCEDPCNIVSYNYGSWEAKSVSCMGTLNRSSCEERDYFGRCTEITFTYERGSIHIEVTNFNNNGQPISFKLTVKWDSETYIRTVRDVSYLNGEQVSADCN
ncbi:MAG: hypothetical protein JXB49_26185 [Bacteroidales bacterium]|nr:hypothetical protein [Bacteroidales bacterium]